MAASFPPLKVEQLHSSLTVVYHKDRVVGVEFLLDENGNYFSPFSDYLPQVGFLRLGTEEVSYVLAKEVYTSLDASATYPMIESPSPSVPTGTYLPIAYLDIKRTNIPQTVLMDRIKIAGVSSSNNDPTIISVESTDGFPSEFLALVGYDVLRVIKRDRESFWIANEGVGWSGSSKYIETVPAIPINKYLIRLGVAHTWEVGTPLYLHSYNPGFNPYTYGGYQTRSDYEAAKPQTTPAYNPSGDWMVRKTAFYNKDFGQLSKMRGKLTGNIPDIYWRTDAPADTGAILSQDGSGRQEIVQSGDLTLTRLMTTFLKMYSDVYQDTDLLADVDYNRAKAAWLPYLLRNYGWEVKTKFTDLWRWQARHGFALFREKGVVKGLRGLLKLLNVDWSYSEKWRNEFGDVELREPEFVNLLDTNFPYIRPTTSGFSTVSTVRPHDGLVDTAKNWDEDYLLTLSNETLLKDSKDRDFAIVKNDAQSLVLDNAEVLENGDIPKKVIKFKQAIWGDGQPPERITVPTASVDTTSNTVNANKHNFAPFQTLVYSNAGGANLTPLTDGSVYYALPVDENNFQLSDEYGVSVSLNFSSAGNNAQTFTPILPWPDTTYPLRLKHNPEGTILTVEGPILPSGPWQLGQFETDMSCLLCNLRFTTRTGGTKEYPNQSILSNPIVPAVPVADMDAATELKTYQNEGSGEFRLSGYLAREYTYKIYTKGAILLGKQVLGNIWGPSEFTPLFAYVNLTTEIGQTRAYRIVVSLPEFANPEMIDHVEVFARNTQPSGGYDLPYHIIATVYTDSDGKLPAVTYDNLTDAELETLHAYNADVNGHYNRSLVFTLDSKYVTYLTMTDTNPIYPGNSSIPQTFSVGPLYGVSNAYLRAHKTADGNSYRYDIYVGTDGWIEDQWSGGSQIKIDDIPPTMEWTTQPYQSISSCKHIGGVISPTGDSGTYSLSLKSGLYPCSMYQAGRSNIRSYYWVGVNGANATVNIPEYSTYYYVRGYVKRTDTNTTVQGVKVTYGCWFTVTDGNGFYELRLPKSLSPIIITAFGNADGTIFGNAQQTLSTLTDNTTLNFSITPATGYTAAVSFTSGIDGLTCYIALQSGATSGVVNSLLMSCPTTAGGNASFTLPDGDYTLYIDPVSRVANTSFGDSDVYFSATAGLSHNFTISGAGTTLGPYATSPDNTMHTASGVVTLDGSSLLGATVDPGFRLSFYAPSASPLNYHEGITPHWLVKADVDIISSSPSGVYPVHPSIKLINGQWSSSSQVPGGTVLVSDANLTYWGKKRWNNGIFHSLGDILVVKNDASLPAFGDCEGGFRQSWPSQNQPTLGAGDTSYYGVEHQAGLYEEFGPISLRPDSITTIRTVEYRDDAVNGKVAGFSHISLTATMVENIINQTIDCTTASPHHLHTGDAITVPRDMIISYPYDGYFRIVVTSDTTFYYAHEIDDIIWGGPHTVPFTADSLTKVTCKKPHGLLDDYVVNIQGSATFTGTYNIRYGVDLGTNVFYIPYPWISNHEIGTWDQNGWHCIKKSEIYSTMHRRYEYVDTWLYRKVSLNVSDASGTYQIMPNSGLYSGTLTVYGNPFAQMVENSGSGFVAFPFDMSTMIPKRFYGGVALKTPVSGPYVIYVEGDEEKRAWALQDEGVTRKPVFDGATYSVCKVVHPQPYDSFRTSDVIFIEVELPRQSFAKEVEIYWDSTKLIFTTSDVFVGFLGTAQSAYDIQTPPFVTGLCPAGSGTVQLTYRFVPSQIERYVPTPVVETLPEMAKAGTHTLTVLALPSGDNASVQIYTTSQDVILR